VFILAEKADDARHAAGAMTDLGKQFCGRASA
jgi:hypothetical protein